MLLFAITFPCRWDNVRNTCHIHTHSIVNVKMANRQEENEPLLNNHSQDDYHDEEETIPSAPPIGNIQDAGELEFQAV